MHATKLNHHKYHHQHTYTQYHHYCSVPLIVLSFLNLNGPYLFKAETMPKIMYTVPCQSHQHFSGQIIKYGFHPSIEWDVLYAWKFWSEKNFYPTSTRKLQLKTNISKIKRIAYLSKNHSHLMWDGKRDSYYFAISSQTN